MNTKVVAQRHRGSNQVQIRTKNGVKIYRRMWIGAMWPTLDYGCACVVGELEPDSENVPFGELHFLDEAKGETTDQLFTNVVNLKDLYCASRFYVDGSNEALKDKFQFGNGLCRYHPPFSKIKEMFPHFKAKHITAFLDDAPQANNPEYGLRLIIDFISSRKLKFSNHIEHFTKLLPITGEIMKTGLAPEIHALRFVLAAIDNYPIYYRETGNSAGFGNFEDRTRSGDDWDGSYQEMNIN
jgi:hypothetical protein